MSVPPSSETPVVPLSRFRTRLAGPRGQRKMEALLAADDPAAEVAALPATEFYQLVMEVGLSESGELMALATPEQFRGCIDLDAWERDALHTEALVPWLQALVELGSDKVAEVWERLDPEFTALALQRLTRIYDLSLDEVPPEGPEAGPVLQTPDTFFAIELCAPDEQTMSVVHRLLEDLYRADPSGTLARHTIMAARSEPPAELEEQSYRWRSGRLADLGYPDTFEALEVFRPLDPSSVELGERTEDRFPQEEPDARDAATAPGVMPAAVTQGVVAVSFLARALDRVSDAGELARLEMALVVLVNKVLAAARIPPGREEALELGAEQAAATLSLGLEAVSGGDLERAVEALRSISLTRLHRAGHTLVLRLARMARALAPRVAGAAGELDAALLSSLCHPRPLFPRLLDTPPVADERPFTAMEDVRMAATQLTTLALRLAIVGALDVDLVALAAAHDSAEPLPSVDDYLRTAAVRAALGQPFAATPLAPDDVATLAARALTDGKLTAAARTAIAEGVHETLDRAQVVAGRELLPALLERWFRDIGERLGHLSGDAPAEPRFLDGFVWESGD